MPLFPPGRRFAAIFYLLLLSMAVVPLFPLLRERPVVIEAAFGAILLSGLATRHARRTVRGILALLGLAIALRVVSQLSPHPQFDLLAGLAFLAIGAVITWLVADYALAASVVDTEHVYASLSVYLLAGLLFGVVYVTLETVAPGSVSHGSGSFTTEKAVYFSFVTLATLGYGDILPQTALARGIAVIEAVVGQFYIAVMVARMVALHIASRPRHDQNASSRPK